MDQAFSEATRSIGKTVLLSGEAFLPAMQRVSVPMLLVHGAKDRLIDVRAAKAAVARCPAVDLRVLDARQDVGWAAALPLGLAPSTLFAS